MPALLEKCSEKVIYYKLKQGKGIALSFYLSSVVVAQARPLQDKRHVVLPDMRLFVYFKSRDSCLKDQVCAPRDGEFEYMVSSEQGSHNLKDSHDPVYTLKKCILSRSLGLSIIFRTQRDRRSGNCACKLVHKKLLLYIIET